MRESARPIVAIVGRPNVGKSALFNRLVGRPLAIVEDLPGTTRDRVFADINWRGRDLTVVDTGGFEAHPATSLAAKVKFQLEMAIAEADSIVLVVDVQDGITAGDVDVAEQLRRYFKPVVLAANKADHPRHDSQAAEFHRLGVGDPIPISSVHGRGVLDLMERVVSGLPEVTAPEVAAYLKVSIVGRPNVGKSMLLNSLLGTERAIVSELPGTTRDSLDTFLEMEGRRLMLIDTAGLRKRGRIEPGIEKYSALRSLRAISRSDVALLVIDATEPIAMQDQHIAGYIQEALKGMVVVVNKRDLVKGVDQAEMADAMRRRLRFIPGTPVVFTSALLGEGVKSVLPAAIKVYEERRKRVPDAVVDGYIKEAVASHNVPRAGKRELMVFKVSQTGVNPPTFLFMVNDSRLVSFSYRRFLANRLRELFGFAGTPLKFVFQNRGE